MLRRAPRFGAAAIASGIVLATGVVAAPFAGAVTVGNPQPEMAQFSLHYAGTTSLSGGTVLADNNTVLASEGHAGTSFTVCTLRPGDRACHYKNSLVAPHNDSLYGVAVVSTGGENVTVLTALAGSFDAKSFPIIAWNSSNDGQTFSAPVVVSSSLSGVDSATVVNGQVVISYEDPHDGLLVQTVDPTGALVATTYAKVSAKDDANDIITNNNGNLLVAAENLDATGGTETDVFSASGTNDLNSAGSYAQVGAFSKRLLDGLSGNGILLDVNGSLTKIGTISFFNGSNFGVQHAVPDSPAGDDGYATLQQTGDVSGRSDTGVYSVFFEGRRNGYDLVKESTTNGTQWKPQTMYGSAANSNEPTPVLSSTGAGVVFESGSGSASQTVQPILFPVSVSIKLGAPAVRTGQTTTLSGQMSIGVQFTKVTLQKLLVGNTWSNQAVSTESIPGQYSFKVGTPATYRVVVNTVPGYLEYGYSNRVILAHKP
jgi:hypothetical protein